MSDLVKIALIAAAPPTITALWAVIVGIYNQRSIKEVHRMVDGTLAVNYQINATSARTLANFTGLEEHKMLAIAAETKLKEHLAVLKKLGLEDKP